MEAMSEEKPQPSRRRPPPRTLSARTTRRALIAVAVGAVVAAIATIAIAGGFGDNDNLRQNAAPGSGSSRGDSEFAAAQQGDCLNWTPSDDPAEDRQDVAIVDCSEEHLFEVVAPLDLSVYPGAEFGPGSRFPGSLRFASIRDEHCVGAVEDYLGGRFDPHGKYSVGLMFPSEQGWADGDRTLRCGLQFSSTTGTLLPSTGSVRESDQSNVWPPGTCIGINQNVPSDPVDCAESHAYEVISTVDMGTHFTGGMPSVEDQDAFLKDVCTQASNEYLGAADALRNKTLTLFWDNLDLDSWLAGSRQINCSVGKELDTGGFASITGSAKGDILINGEAPVPPPPVGEGRATPVPLPGAAPIGG
ncbi:septum formation family protein [Rhodococcus sp. HNM0569]|uniref:septum formation family protein n=1 Tax=Rhodococcus sp. HNM0569 TaxID=2716340 RepID=UPI00146B8B7C|nr:septum formation family protein [Rhodococcus sp. HNM0569]NLU84811.1 septum formation family protein [Rhodococcus sp. HNM0569]